MLAMDGNTATYMQYAYARNRSIFRKGDVGPDAHSAATRPPMSLDQPDERALALQLLRFEEALQAAAADYRPNVITAYLWDLAKSYSGFFQNCPVLKAETPAAAPEPAAAVRPDGPGHSAGVRASGHPHGRADVMTNPFDWPCLVAKMPR